MTPDESPPAAEQGAHEVGAGVNGSPEDPHAQARAARGRPLLLHSMTVFRELFETIFRCREIGTVIEVGVESGQVSSLYADLGATVHCVEPDPGDELRAALADDPRLNLVEGLSPAVLGDLPVGDLYVLDGDHNYAVVRGELRGASGNDGLRSDRGHASGHVGDLPRPGSWSGRCRGSA